MRHSLRTGTGLLSLLAFSASLLSANAHAQTTAPPPPAGSYQAAPPPQQGDYRAAPPPQQGDYQAPQSGAAPAAPNFNGPAPQQARPAQPYYQQQGYPQNYPAPPPPPPAGYPPPPPYAAAPYVTPQAYRAQMRPKRAMMITGASLLGGSYALSMIIGAALLDNRDNRHADCKSCGATGRWLFVPIAGPFGAMSRTSGGDVGLLMLGMVEVVGLGLLIGGIIRYRNSLQEIAGRRAALSWDLGKERVLSLDVKTSTAMAGPMLRLDF